LNAGARAAGQKHWGLCSDARADMVVLNVNAPGLLGMPDSHLLDAAMFACDNSAVRDVYVAGRQVIADGQHLQQTPIAAQFASAMQSLWQDC
jgi:formimidoylglutamate deiminase